MEPRDPATGPSTIAGQGCTAVRPRLAAGLPALASLSLAACVRRGQVDSGPEPEAVRPSTRRAPAGQGPQKVRRLPCPVSLCVSPGL